jgi:hypothetical protein
VKRLYNNHESGSQYKILILECGEGRYNIPANFFFMKDKWYEKPHYICGKCGYHKDSCVCKFQKNFQNKAKVVKKPKPIKTSIDFYE